MTDTPNLEAFDIEAAKRKPTVAQLRKILAYDPDTGVFTWRISLSNRAPAGTIAGGKTSRGYIQIRLNGEVLHAHHLAWLFVHGEWPSGQIDHKDRIHGNNAISNLRLATQRQNNANKLHSNRLGVRGVARHHNRFRAVIQNLGKKIHLGVYATKEEAFAAYSKAAREFYGEFACLENK